MIPECSRISVTSIQVLRVHTATPVHSHVTFICHRLALGSKVVTSKNAVTCRARSRISAAFVCFSCLIHHVHLEMCSHDWPLFKNMIEQVSYRYPPDKVCYVITDGFAPGQVHGPRSSSQEAHVRLIDVYYMHRHHNIRLNACRTHSY